MRGSGQGEPAPRAKVTVTWRKAWALQFLQVAEALKSNMLSAAHTHENTENIQPR